MARKFGRKPVLITCQCTIVITWLLFAFGVHFHMFLAAGLLFGLATGLGVVAGQLYLVEIASTNARGFIIGTTALSLVFYNLVNYVLGAFLLWKWVAVANCAIHVGYLALTWAAVPESPKWLISQGRVEEADNVAAYFSSTSSRW
jgi:putative MFS transporter